MVSLDGVMQAPGGPEEDPSGGFKYGGWTVPFSDESFGPILDREMSEPFDLLLGRKTYDIWTSYWPHQTGLIADRLNWATKYVVSSRGGELTWKESVLIQENVVNQIKALKGEDGPVFHVWGSSVLIQTLLKNDLVDELRLRIYPVWRSEMESACLNQEPSQQHLNSSTQRLCRVALSSPITDAQEKWRLGRLINWLSLASDR